ncbi:hypothetical protein CANMA_002942 [Candida margitis]|uniref:uncharacterized protein n=1 Tax=Candida margitis TaxID=1775924 RepID=UPI002226A6B4|nr:uncharacterized protein CANMA_002942 [Candida margitis]KAI5967762.1 hypothetical protein CANMA_002942 [Candida margitis]
MDSAPRVRFQRLQVLGRRAVEQVLKTSFSKEQIKQCYPHIMESEAGAAKLQTGVTRLQEYLHDSTVTEFNHIYEENSLPRQLDELDELIYLAQERKRRGGYVNEEKQVQIDKLSAENIMSSIVLSEKEDVLGKLKLIYEQLCKDNDDMLQSLDEKSKENETLSSKVFEVWDPILRQKEVIPKEPVNINKSLFNKTD